MMVMMVDKGINHGMKYWKNYLKDKNQKFVPARIQKIEKMLLTVRWTQMF